MDNEVAEYTTMVSENYASLNECWGAMDGLKVGLESAGDEETQNRFYDSWKCDHYISKLFYSLLQEKFVLCISMLLALSMTAQWPRCLAYDTIDNIYV